MSIKEGEKIKINFAWDHGDHNKPKRKSSFGGTTSPTPAPLLAPPPAHHQPPQASELTPGGETQVGEEDWGDFEGPVS